MGQNENYYETINSLSELQREKILVGLRDCAFNLEIFEAARDQEVMRRSLLRTVAIENVIGRLHRLAVGDVTLTHYSFSYTLPTVAESAPPVELTFEVIPGSQPPTNVHVLIGRNGVGKTRCMAGLARAMLGRSDQQNPVGAIAINVPAGGRRWAFAGLVAVSFSAFDSVDLRPRPDDRIPSRQVGLISFADLPDGTTEATIRTQADLVRDFVDSFARCRTGLRASRWRAAIQTLEADDLFAEAELQTLLDADEETWSQAASHVYSRLSSGHAIVLLTITRLVELVDEGTLVLLDEPEGHLHPPLLSGFVRALSDLLVQRNGVAIVATHSPVVLQEVPRSSAWKLRRSGLVTAAERPTTETFGENVGVLTREVFGFEVTRSGYHRLIEQVVVEPGRPNFLALVERFGDQLGNEARAIAQSLISSRDRD